MAKTLYHRTILSLSLLVCEAIRLWCAILVDDPPTNPCLGFQTGHQEEERPISVTLESRWEALSMGSVIDNNPPWMLISSSTIYPYLRKCSNSLRMLNATAAQATVPIIIAYVLLRTKVINVGRAS